MGKRSPRARYQKSEDEKVEAAHEKEEEGEEDEDKEDEDKEEEDKEDEEEEKATERMKALSVEETDEVSRLRGGGDGSSDSEPEMVGEEEEAKEEKATKTYEEKEKEMKEEEEEEEEEEDKEEEERAPTTPMTSRTALVGLGLMRLIPRDKVKRVAGDDMRSFSPSSSFSSSSSSQSLVSEERRDRRGVGRRGRDAGGWRRYEDPAGEYYYHHPARNLTVRERPEAYDSAEESRAERRRRLRRDGEGRARARGGGGRDERRGPREGRSVRGGHASEEQKRRGRGEGYNIYPSIERSDGDPSPEGKKGVGGGMKGGGPEDDDGVQRGAPTTTAYVHNIHDPEQEEYVLDDDVVVPRGRPRRRKPRPKARETFPPPDDDDDEYDEYDDGDNEAPGQGRGGRGGVTRPGPTHRRRRRPSHEDNYNYTTTRPEDAAAWRPSSRILDGAGLEAYLDVLLPPAPRTPAGAGAGGRGARRVPDGPRRAIYSPSDDPPAASEDKYDPYVANKGVNTYDRDRDRGKERVNDDDDEDVSPAPPALSSTTRERLAAFLATSGALSPTTTTEGDLGGAPSTHPTSRYHHGRRRSLSRASRGSSAVPADVTPTTMAPWLDVLINALWNDLQILDEWERHEARHERFVQADTIMTDGDWAPPPGARRDHDDDDTSTMIFAANTTTTTTTTRRPGQPPPTHANLTDAEEAAQVARGQRMRQWTEVRSSRPTAGVGRVGRHGSGPTEADLTRLHPVAGDVLDEEMLRVARVGPAYNQTGWMHLGCLAIRLGLRTEAERAFRLASSPDLHVRPCLTAAIFLADLYAMAGGKRRRSKRRRSRRRRRR